MAKPHKVIVLSALGVFGVALDGFDVNPHLQALFMWLFAALAVIGLVLDKDRCGSSIPLGLAVAGLVIIVGTLYAYYEPMILMMGYAILVIAAFLNQSIRLRQLNQQVLRQAEILSEFNATLEQRIESQVEEIEKLGRLKRFLTANVAELVLNEGEGSHLDNHRRDIVILFCDIRGFTSFSESMEPEEVMTVLGTYHEHMGRLVAAYEATIDHRAGDGMMLFFNDPLPCEQPVLKAVRLAVDMRDEFGRLNEVWTKRGYNLGFGIGIAAGYATLGIIGFEGRYDYTANGNAVNLAARLCDHAGDGQILISTRALTEVEDHVQAEPVEELQLKGIGNPVVALNVVSLAPSDEPGSGTAG